MDPRIPLVIVVADDEQNTEDMVLMVDSTKLSSSIVMDSAELIAS